LVLATSRIAALEAELGETLQIMAALSADDMAAWQCRHPLSALGDGRPVLHGDHVTDDSGTGIVHTAPAHGYDDFLVCKEFGLEPLSPLDDSGCFHADAPGPWAGLAALDEGTDAIIEALSGAGMLISEHEHVHSYPYDWRTKKPVLTRATQQWFTDLSHLQGQAADALRDVDIIPARGRDRLSKMVTTRKEVQSTPYCFHLHFEICVLSLRSLVVVVHIAAAIVGCSNTCVL
jgi:isoleucyl-tRNA synthetase